MLPKARVSPQARPTTEASVLEMHWFVLPWFPNMLPLFTSGTRRLGLPTNVVNFTSSDVARWVVR